MSVLLGWRRWVVRAMWVAAAGAAGPAVAAPASGEPLYFGVSGPLTGQNAQYGAQWKAGFDLDRKSVV